MRQGREADAVASRHLSYNHEGRNIILRSRGRIPSPKLLSSLTTSPTSLCHYVTTSPSHLLDRMPSLSCEPRYAKCRNPSSTQTSMRTSCKLRTTEAGDRGTKTSERMPIQSTNHHSMALLRRSGRKEISTKSRFDKFWPPEHALSTTSKNSCV